MQIACVPFFRTSVNAFGPGIWRIEPWNSRRFGLLMIMLPALQSERLPTVASIRRWNELFPS
jgi:hypothetical protein